MRIFILYIRTDPTDVPAFQKNVAKIMAITYFEVESRSEAVAGWQRDFFKRFFTEARPTKLDLRFQGLKSSGKLVLNVSYKVLR